MYYSIIKVIFKSLFLSIFVIFPLANNATAAEYHCYCSKDLSCVYGYTDEAKVKAACVNTSGGCAVGSGSCPTTAKTTQKVGDSTGTSVKDSSGCSVVNGITTCKLVNPLSSDTTDVNKIIGTVIKGVLGLVGALALFVFVQGGFEWLTSRGNPEKVQKGTKTMLWAFVGLMLVFMAYGFLTFILGLLTKGK